MFSDETRVLMILPRELVDRARSLAGKTTMAMKLPVSLQIVFRALIEEGLRHPADPALLANIGRQAEAVRRIRSEARRRPSAAGASGSHATRPRASAGSRRSS
jgi:hypothetical protein